MSRIWDFHSHILPCVDDGSKSVEESIAMLKTEAEQGIQRVVATPHFYAHHDSPEAFLKRREASVAALREAMVLVPGLPEISVGAEVHFFSGISETEHLKELTIDRSKCILIEMPCAPWTEKMYRELEAIYSKHGITPIIAHVDRYLSPFRTHGIPQRLAELPVMVQANGSFFLNRSTAWMAYAMLKKNQIHLLGSDCHNLDVRPPNLEDVVSRIETKLGKDALIRIESCQRAVCSLL